MFSWAPLGAELSRDIMTTSSLACVLKKDGISGAADEFLLYASMSRRLQAAEPLASVPYKTCGHPTYSMLQ